MLDKETHYCKSRTCSDCRYSADVSQKLLSQAPCERKCSYVSLLLSFLQKALAQCVCSILPSISIQLLLASARTQTAASIVLSLWSAPLQPAAESFFESSKVHTL